MAIPAPEHDYQRQLAVFTQMNQAFLTLKARYPQIDTLSMGMTDDMDAAISAGSTLVRIGTAILVPAFITRINHGIYCSLHLRNITLC